jgi:hypothetical protein
MEVAGKFTRVRAPSQELLDKVRLFKVIRVEKRRSNFIALGAGETGACFEAKLESRRYGLHINPLYNARSYAVDIFSKRR